MNEKRAKIVGLKRLGKGKVDRAQEKQDALNINSDEKNMELIWMLQERAEKLNYQDIVDELKKLEEHVLGEVLIKNKKLGYVEKKIKSLEDDILMLEQLQRTQNLGNKNINNNLKQK